MRQVGIIAAAGIYALNHHLERLKEDHHNAKRLAVGMKEFKGVSIDPKHVETNIVIFDVGVLAMGMRCLLLVWVRGRSRVPRPPAVIRARMHAPGERGSRHTRPGPPSASSISMTGMPSRMG